MTKMTKEVNKEMVNHSGYEDDDLVSLTVRISKQSATNIIGFEVYDCESVDGGTVFVEDGKYYLTVEEYKEAQCWNTVSDLIEGRY